MTSIVLLVSHIRLYSILLFGSTVKSGLLEKQDIKFTFKAAAEGTSGSLLKGFAISEYKFKQCRIRTSPMLNDVGAPSNKTKEN